MPPDELVIAYKELWGYPPPPWPTSLLYANKLVAREANSIIYGENTFIVSARDRGFWLKKIGPINRSCIRSLVVRLFDQAPFLPRDVGSVDEFHVVIREGCTKLENLEYSIRCRKIIDSPLYSIPHARGWWQAFAGIRVIVFNQ